MSYEQTVEGIRDATTTQVPALLLAAVEAAVKSDCFTEDESIIRFVRAHIRFLNECREDH